MQAIIRPKVLPVTGGLILYDAELAGKVHEHVFAPAYWRARDAFGDESLGGRGAAWRIQDEGIDWVLRFYRRGGLPGKFISDWYLFTGLERTRPWREWNLLAAMYDLGLPVPHPVAARIRRGWLGYHAALITETVPGESLARLLLDDEMTEAAWRAVGKCIRRFHDAGVWHADLNAHNILIDDAGAEKPEVYLIDFDRGRMRPQDTAWRQGNLDRLRRSLAKITADTHAAERATNGFALLNAAYRGD
ncbi:MAG TPA: 3-deoxy-D-manno-octulosonic acid kinase [Gammaproteobacteria bacterium]